MAKKKILPWLSVTAALIFALPVNATETNAFAANTPDMYTAEKYIEKNGSLQPFFLYGSLHVDWMAQV